MRVERIAAFADGEVGGNPAGVVVCDVLPEAIAMQALAAEVGYSETVFAAPSDQDWFAYSVADLDERIPPAIAHAGADHLVLALKSRERLSAMRYEIDAGRTLTGAEGIGTISLIYGETPQLFHVRNPFPIGGVYEDPATGAAAAALAGYLRDLGWPH